VKYVSTRRAAPAVSLSEAILLGLAPDKGLYVPEEVPRAEGQPPGTRLVDAAHWMLAPFFRGDALAAHLSAILDEAFTFPAPLVTTNKTGTYLLELFHGPTAAFKDFGARFLAACFQRLAPQRRTTVLVATSGDTGSAVGAAFHGLPNIRVAILYPEGRVSARQAHQLGSFGGNVHALVVKGTFDDCQGLVKRALGDAQLREQEPLASANSVSLGRLLPQLAYYTHAAFTHVRTNRGPLSFAVPTGNLGNAFACVLARAAGAPIGEILLATNANRGVADFVRGTPYSARPTLATLANAMDVGDASNFERLNWLYPTPEMGTVPISDAAGQKGGLSPFPGLFGEWVDDETIRARIQEGEEKYGQVFCPHTACSIEAVERRRKAGDTKDWCAVATAHPAKFESVVEPLVGHTVAPPPALAQMLARPSRAEPLEPTDAALRAWLLAK
jgi:threonine synthase